MDALYWIVELKCGSTNNFTTFTGFSTKWFLWGENLWEKLTDSGGDYSENKAEFE